MKKLFQLTDLILKDPAASLLNLVKNLWLQRSLLKLITIYENTFALLSLLKLTTSVYSSSVATCIHLSSLCEELCLFACMRMGRSSVPSAAGVSAHLPLRLTETVIRGNNSTCFTA